MNVESNDNDKNVKLVVVYFKSEGIHWVDCILYELPTHSITNIDVTIYAKIPQLQDTSGCIPEYFANLTTHKLPLAAHHSHVTVHV